MAAPATNATCRVHGPPRRPLLHFLFLLRGSFLRPDIWAEYFRAAPSDAYMVWAHCTDRKSCLAHPSVARLNARVVPTVPTKRNIDLMTPLVQMLGAAMAETEPILRNGGLPERFVLLSDSTLPVKPFGYTYKELFSHRGSCFCAYRAFSWHNGSIDGVRMRLVRHHQWVALNRRDAWVIVRDWDHGNWEDVGHAWRIPLKAGRWAGQNRSIKRIEFRKAPQNGRWPPSNEEAPWALAKGPVLHDDDLVFDYVKCCITWVFFPENAGWPRTIEKYTRLVVGSDGWAPPHFKLPPHLPTREILSRAGNRLILSAGRSHPFVLDFLTDESLQALRNSSFLFARKFAANARLPNFAKLMFH